MDDAAGLSDRDADAGLWARQGLRTRFLGPTSGDGFAVGFN